MKRPVPDKDIVDVTINLNEDKQYFINRIEFEGNTTTRDKVIRRELWFNEQDVVNMEMLKASIRRINQLGYFRPIEQPDIQPIEGEDNKLDISSRSPSRIGISSPSVVVFPVWREPSSTSDSRPPIFSGVVRRHLSTSKRAAEPRISKLP